MSRRLALMGALALGLAGCPVDEVRGGRYACAIDGGAAQCPGDWRCGFEGYCHAVGDTTVPWRCEADRHCEGGWKCGLSAARDAGECHDPDAGAPFACAGSAQCSAGWHCGADGTCHDGLIAAPYACRDADAGLNDGWCEQGWRCAPDGRCVDPKNDALGGMPLRPFGAGAQIHPLGDATPYERFSVSPTYATGLGAGKQIRVIARGGKLSAALIDSRGAVQVTRYELGPYEGTAFLAMGSRGDGTSGTAPFFAADDVSRAYLALPDAGLNAVQLNPNGTATIRSAPVDYPTTRLRMGSAAADLAPHALAFTSRPDQFHLLFGEPDYFLIKNYLFETDFPTASWDTPGNRVVDALTVRGLDRVECVFAADTRGLWVAQKSYTAAIDNVAFEAVEVGRLTNDFCAPPTATSQRITGLTSFGREWLGVGSTSLDGGAAFVTLLDLNKMWNQGSLETFCTTFSGGPCEQATRIPIESRMGPCPVCAGGTLLDFAIVAGTGGEPAIEVRCGGPDGSTSGFFTLSPTASASNCSRAVATGEGGLFSTAQLTSAESPVGGVVAWASSTTAFLWSGPSTEGASSELFDRAAAAVARRGPALADAVAFAGSVNAAYVEGAGFLGQAGRPAVAAVEGAPEWVVTGDRLVLNLADAGTYGTAALLGLTGTAVTPFTAPHNAAYAQRTDGGHVLVVVANTSLFSAEMDDAIAGRQLYAPVTLKAVTPSPVESIAFPTQSPAAVYMRGYAVTPNGVLRVTAQTSTRWGFEDVPLPPDLVPLEVWFEGTRGRVGFADGTVYALPSRVAIAPPLLDGVVDYAQACGQQLALASTGLYRLEPGAGAIGKWAGVALPAGFADAGFAKGRVHGVGAAAYVFTRGGEAARVVFDNCPAP